MAVNSEGLFSDVGSGTWRGGAGEGLSSKESALFVVSKPISCAQKERGGCEMRGSVFV